VKLDALRRQLEAICGEFAPVALASSLSAEDMVLTDLIARRRLPIGVFMLDTGRLHAETLLLLDETRKRYGIEVRAYWPDPAAVDGYVRRHGRDGFYDGIEQRRRCCEIRKVEPLKRARAGPRAGSTAPRRGHSSGRAELAEREYDAEHGLEKLNPLAAWSEDEVWQYLRANGVPYNRLYDQGYRSIGCAPCTRPVLPGEEPRAGRWWWESPQHSECGLHPRQEPAHAG